MGAIIKFKMNADKAFEALKYICEGDDFVSPFFASKALFYADKWHLNQHGRPVTGDLYCAMKDGPVPNFSRDVMKKKIHYLKDIPLDRIETAFQFKERVSPSGKYEIFRSTGDVNRKILSRTDMACLDRAKSEILVMPYPRLWDRVHSERSYLSTKRDHFIDYRLMVDDDNPYRDEILADMEESSAYWAL